MGKERSGRAMYNKILVAVDGSENALRAVREAVRLAKGNPEAEITLITIVPPLDSAFAYGTWFTPQEVQDREKKVIDALLARAEEIIREAEEVAREDGAEKIKSVVQVGDPAQAIVTYAEKEKFDVIVMGKRGRGIIRELLLGSVSNKVVHLAPCPVLLVH
ncbi:universal stress protein [Ammonifex thiophilus]|uniref:Universal stress protein n=2 Tax=Ammonifex thiophilus TaxID=444093 RepID=A0A3D8P2S6_9THEO|nr:universal stress protein [Ammonifex thiophilus]